MPPLPRSLCTSVLALCLLPGALPAEQIAGVANFHRVDGYVYRGAQPTAQGFARLAKLGIATVVDLRGPGKRSAWERRTVERAGMRYVNIPMRGLMSPGKQPIERAVSLLEDGSAGPVFVHCRRGADRTGTVIACYRIAHDRWDNRKALSEARSLGMSRFELDMQHFIQHYRVK